MISARNSASTGQVFQSGIGGSVSSGTLRRLGQVLQERVGRQRRVELAPGRRRHPDQLGLVHLDALELAGRSLDAEGRRRDRAFEDRRGQQADLVIALGRLRQCPLEQVASAGNLVQRQLSAGPCPLRSTWTVTSPPPGASPGLGNRTRIWIGWPRW